MIRPDRKKNKIDFNELIQDHQISDIDNFGAYLIYIWKELAKKDSISFLGINFSSFSNVIRLFNLSTMLFPE